MTTNQQTSETAKVELGRRAVTVYDVPSGLGGAFTVSIAREVCADQVEVRIWYGRATERGWESWGEFDGHRMTVRRDALRNERVMRTVKAPVSYYA